MEVTSKELMASRCADVSLRDAGLVWHDHLTHHEVLLSSRALELMCDFSTWRPRCRHTTSRCDGSCPSTDELDTLVELDILKIRGGHRDRLEATVERVWGEEVRLARAFHFGTRTLGDQEFVNLTAAKDEIRARRGSLRRPNRTRRRGARSIELGMEMDWQSLTSASFASVLCHRRSVRKFSRDPVPKETLETLLCFGAGALEVERSEEIGEYFKRVSASGGSLQPVDLYCAVSLVSDIEPGRYFFDPVRGDLTWIGNALTDSDLLLAAGGQAFFVDAPLTLWFSADVRSEFWKYGCSRSYRVLLADWGCLLQTLSLVATALGLGSVVSCAVRDEVVEDLFGLCLTRDVVIGAMALGFPAG
jgi:SagB-type dehydrogenase family enzyme